MRGLWSAALVVATMLVAMGTARAQFIGIPKPAPIVVTVTKSDQRMVVAVDGQPRFKWWVSTGARGYATPSGHYKVSWLDEHHKSKQYNDAPMPYAIFFDEGKAIHGFAGSVGDDRQRQNAVSFGRAGARPSRLQIRYDDHRSLICCLAHSSSLAVIFPGFSEPTRFELGIILKSAKDCGLDVPPRSLLPPTGLLHDKANVCWWPLATDRIIVADGRFGCEADLAGPAAGSTRSLVTHSGPGHAILPWAMIALPERI